MAGNEDGQGARQAAAAFVVSSLAARAQSVAEIEAKLARRGVPDELAATVIDEAIRLGYLDDDELAGQLARGHVSRGFGRRRAASALRRRGLSAETTGDALAAAYGSVDEVELARKALGTRTPDDEAARRRAVAFLTRRGFSSAACWRAVRSQSEHV